VWQLTTVPLVMASRVADLAMAEPILVTRAALGGFWPGFNFTSVFDGKFATKRCVSSVPEQS
jgi:hypothetical protein